MSGSCRKFYNGHVVELHGDALAFDGDAHPEPLRLVERRLRHIHDRIEVACLPFLLFGVELSCTS